MAARQSAVEFKAVPAVTQNINGWDVVQAFEGQGGGPFLVDLSHCPCMDIQDRNLDQFPDLADGLAIPKEMNGISRCGSFLISRMNATQCMVWGLDGTLPEFNAFSATDISGGMTILALVGKDTDKVIEKLAPLDLFKPQAEGLALCQAPIHHIPCQIMVLDRETKVVIVAFARGYGQDMANSILSAGKEHRLQPGGSNVISQWLESI